MKTKLIFGLAGLTLFLSSCIPGLQAPPDPRTRSYAVAEYFNVSAQLNGQPVELEATGSGNVLQTESFDITVALSPNELQSYDRSEYNANYAYNREIAFLLRQISYESNPSGFGFSLQNKSSEPIQIVWDETAVVTPDGSSSRVIHEGVQFSEMDRSQPPTVIPPSARVDEYAGPTSKISYSSNSGWFEEGLFLEFSEGDSASLFLVMEANGERQNLSVTYTATKPFQYAVEIPE